MQNRDPLVSLKRMKTNKIHKMHTPEILGHVYFEETKSRLRQDHRPRGAWRDPKIDEQLQNPQDACSKHPGVLRKKSLRQDHRPRVG